MLTPFWYRIDVVLQQRSAWYQHGTMLRLIWYHFWCSYHVSIYIVPFWDHVGEWNIFIAAKINFTEVTKNPKVLIVLSQRSTSYFFKKKFIDLLHARDAPVCIYFLRVKRHENHSLCIKEVQIVCSVESDKAAHTHFCQNCQLGGTVASPLRKLPVTSGNLQLTKTGDSKHNISQHITCRWMN